MRFTLEVKDKGHLKKILTKLQQIPDVLEVRRSY
jgi:GTP pyrophosphokinase